jgi:acetolactate synthase-1/2/3 large subunit
MPKKTLKNCTVADAYLAVLADRGVDYLFANAGTDFAPLIEALAKAQALGTPIPEPITCPHSIWRSAITWCPAGRRCRWCM